MRKETQHRRVDATATSPKDTRKDTPMTRPSISTVNMHPDVAGSWAGAVTASVLLLLFSLSTVAAETDDSMNPYPETLAEIAKYKEHILREYHGGKCFYPRVVTEISTLKELSEYAGKSGVHVKMKLGSYDKVFISNTTVLRHWGAFLAGGKTVKIVNCKVDLLYGAFLIRYGGTGHEVDLTLVPADPQFLPVEIGTKGASALISGREHKIVLRREGELRIKNPPPIRITGEEIELRNDTGLPIELTRESRNCRIITNGKVIDQGEGK